MRDTPKENGNSYYSHLQHESYAAHIDTARIGFGLNDYGGDLPSLTERTSHPKQMQSRKRNATVSDRAQLPRFHNRTANTGQIHKHTQPICLKDGRTATLHSNTGDAPIADLACITE